MWKVVPGIPLSLLPRRWRAVSNIPEETVPWVSAAILSGILESILAVGGLTYWYSYSVTTWAAEALDSALNNGPTAGYDPHVLGLAAFVVWCIHPLTWLLASIFAEGLVRIVAAISIEQILPMWILAFADWCFGKFTHRPPEGDALDRLGGREQLRSFIRAAKQAAKTARLSELPDELTESADGRDSLLEIHSSHEKSEWTPPRVVRVDSVYYRLESFALGARPRPFVYRLRRLSAGVPGRNVILYRSPVGPDSAARQQEPS
jgi:hypothetical protein